MRFYLSEKKNIYLAPAISMRFAGVPFFSSSSIKWCTAELN
jgi:hypothetical protein